MKLRVLSLTAVFLAVGLLLFWQHSRVPAARTVGSAARVPVDVAQTPVHRSSTCSGRFVPHRLDFATGTRLREINTYVSNGAGVAVNDLDGDGDLDLVFASVDGESAILWNRGGLEFEAEALDDRFTRGVAAVDVDGDGQLDLVFTHRGLEPPSYWRNQGAQAPGPRFVRQPLPNVDHYAYAMAWGDLNADGRLDLVTASYGVELIQHGMAEPDQDARAGVVLYLSQGDGFVPQVLDRRAETLAIGLVDLDEDGHPEIWAANDFALEDQVWQRVDDVWRPIEPFGQTSHSTMSIDWGDIANDGVLALVTTDMNPYDISPRTLAEWLPVVDRLSTDRYAQDPQIMANVLQVRASRGWRNEATRRGVDATGWSWASRFGDLDQDGYLDLYVVNGMIAQDMFGHLHNGELVEQNQAFRNQGNGDFSPAPEWNLGATASGRGMVMADLDDDGDLDIVVNNLRGLAELHENQLCRGDSLQVDLRWAGSANTHAIGAQLALHTSAGIQRRDVRASGGYLSGDAQRVHFGFPAEAELEKLEILWPDGAVSTVDQPPANARLTLSR